MQSHNRDEISSRDIILEAAMHVVAEKKISGIRMREVAGKAQISTGTLHYHFPTKELLLQSLLDDMDRVFNEERAIRFSEMGLDPTGKLFWFLDQESQLLKDRRELAEVFIDFWSHGLKASSIKGQIQRMYDRWREDIEVALKGGRETQQFDSSHLALIPSLLVSLMEGAALQYLIDESAFDLEAYFRASYEMVLCFLINGKENGKDISGEGARDSNPSDVDDETWAEIEPLIRGNSSIGRPRNVDLRGVINGILFVISSGCSWRMLPQSYPNWSTVYRYFSLWKRDGVWQQIADVVGV